MQTTPSGLQFIDTVEGSGDAAQKGQHVHVHYTGWLFENGELGEKFDSSVDRNEPFDFPLGAGWVIKGWDEGVAGTPRRCPHWRRDRPTRTVEAHGGRRVRRPAVSLAHRALGRFRRAHRCLCDRISRRRSCDQRRLAVLASPKGASGRNVKWLMLMDLKGPLADKSMVPVTLMFENVKGVKSQVELQVPVRSMSMHHEHKH